MPARVIDPLTHLNAIRFAFWLKRFSSYQSFYDAQEFFYAFLPLILSFR